MHEGQYDVISECSVHVLQYDCIIIIIVTQNPLGVICVGFDLSCRWIL